jgi:hypothetical protein
MKTLKFAALALVVGASSLSAQAMQQGNAKTDTAKKAAAPAHPVAKGGAKAQTAPAKADAKGGAEGHGKMAMAAADAKAAPAKSNERGNGAAKADAKKDTTKKKK